MEFVCPEGIPLKKTTKWADGPHNEFFVDGTLSAEGQSKSSLRHGNWKYYYRNAKLKAVDCCVNGEFHREGHSWRLREWHTNPPCGSGTTITASCNCISTIVSCVINNNAETLPE